MIKEVEEGVQEGVLAGGCTSRKISKQKLGEEAKLTRCEAEAGVSRLAEGKPIVALRPR